MNGGVISTLDINGVLTRHKENGKPIITKLSMSIILATVLFEHVIQNRLGIRLPRRDNLNFICVPVWRVWLTITHVHFCYKIFSILDVCLLLRLLVVVTSALRNTAFLGIEEIRTLLILLNIGIIGNWGFLIHWAGKLLSFRLILLIIHQNPYLNFYFIWILTRYRGVSLRISCT